MMSPIAVKKLLWRKEELTIKEAAILLLVEGQSSALEVAETEITNAIYAGEIHTFSGYSGAIPPYTRHEYIHMGDFKLFLESLSAEIKQAVSAPSKMEKPISKTQQQDNAILNWLKDNGYDPQALAKGKPGKPGIRKACGDGVCKNMGMFSSRSVFEKAWDRLRADDKTKEIK